MYKEEGVVVGKFMFTVVNQLRLQSSKAVNLHSKNVVRPRYLTQPKFRLLHNMAQQYASKQPAGFDNRIKNVAIVGVCPSDSPPFIQPPQSLPNSMPSSLSLPYAFSWSLTY
jgi:hypothetical protein